MKNIRILIDIKPEGIFYCEESEMQKEMVSNKDCDNEHFDVNSEMWTDWFEVKDLKEITDWLED